MSSLFFKKINMIDDIRKACEVLQAGGIILYPTDTIWGIGCDATNEVAIKKVYDIKKRADNKAMLVLMDSTAKLQNYVNEVPDIAWDLIEVAEKPLTVIYSGARNLAPNLLGEDNSVGIRITSEAFSKKLCERFRRPIVSTSANISGKPSPTFFSEISEEIKQSVDFIVNFRQEDQTKATPSSIIKIEPNGVFKLIR